MGEESNSKTRNESGDVTATWIYKAKSIIGEYDECEWLYTNKLDKLNKMEKFLETHKLQKPTQEEMEYLKNYIK